jgi:cytochrome b involved in lipid metabolism
MKSVKQVQEYSFSDVYKHNLKNDLWIIINGKVYDVTKWIRKHPGGDILLLGIAGQDASMPFVSYHDQKKIDLLIRRFEIGSVKNYKSTKLAKNFEQLRQILVNDGLFNTNWIYYRLIFVWYNFLFIMVWYKKYL